ncbi:YciI family protein [Phytoactinopolyspora limicola]|uniref:YciI family protein n=1 Tax=Phytoactinopolyspora limicola TaxID=2715536 RepID=UPI0014098A87|nr:YciI family protein [Phytoactinopolyspora limicola]
MRFVLLMCDDDASWPTPEEIAADPEHQSWSAQMRSRRILVDGGQLRPSTEATTVRVRGDETLVSDGPFIETKDLIGGFAVIECPDLDTAIEVAASHPVARSAVVEIRPFWET